MTHQLTGKKNKFILLIISFIFLNTISLKEKNVIFGNVKDIKVIGLENHLNETIKDRLNYLKNNRLFTINKEILTKQITNYNYIESFKVFKLYPDTIILNLKQTKFLASTLIKNKKYLIGSNAKLIDYDLVSENKDLPIIYGNFQPEDFIILKKKINRSPIEFNNIKNFFFYPSLRWDIQNNNNIKIKLPYRNIDEALIIAKKIIDNNNSKINTIDLRIKNQIILTNE